MKIRHYVRKGKNSLLMLALWLSLVGFVYAADSSPLAELNVSLTKFEWTRKSVRSESLSPSGAVLVNEAERLPARSKTFLLGGVLFLCAQTVVILLLWFNIVSRKRAEEALRHSEEFLKTIYQNSEIGVFVVNVTEAGDYVYEGINQVHERLLGLKNQDIAGKTPNDLIPFLEEGTIRYVSALYDACVQKGATIESEFYVPEGEAQGWWLSRVTPLRDTQGRVYRLVGSSIVITALKEAQQALQESEERFELAMQATSDGLFDWNLVTNEIYYSPGWKSMIGYEDHELPDRFSVWEHLTEAEDVKKSWEMMREHIEGKREHFEMEFKMRHKDGHWVDVLSRANAVRDEHGKAVRVVGMHIDISGRKKVEEALRFSNRRTQQYLDVAGVMLIAVDLNQRVILINPKGCEILGYPEQDILGQNWFDTFLPNKDAAEVKQVFNQIISGAVQPVEYYENSILRKDGSERMIAWHNSVLRDSSENITGLFSSGEDITDRKRAEEDLRRSENTWRSLVENSPDFIYTVDAEGTVLFINRTFPEHSKEMVVKRTVFDFLPPDDHDAMRERLRTLFQGGTAERFETHMFDRDGIRIVVETRFAPIKEKDTVVSIIGISTDITQRKQAEQKLQGWNRELEQRIEARTRELHETQNKLLRQEKLAVLGQLAGSVAHELRHPLGVLSNAAYFLNMSLTDADEMTKEYLTMITAEVRQSDKIISDLLDFSRNQPREKSAKVETSLAVLLDEALVTHLPPDGVEIVRSINHDLPPIFGDPQQIKQVFTNLLINAYQSMPDGGTLFLTIQPDGGMVKVEFKDSGCGIAPEHLEHLFEPLFTTKPKGIGLGLAISKSLLEANGGHMIVESIEGEGSTFRVNFPGRYAVDE